MNIAFCYPTGYNPERGGVERVTYLLAEELAQRGHKIFFLHNKRINLTEYPFPTTIDFFPTEDYNDETNLRWFHQYLVNNEIDFVINQCGAFGDSTLYCNTTGKTKSISVIHAAPGVNLNYLFSEVSQLRSNPDAKEYAKRIARILAYPWIKRATRTRYKKHYEWMSTHTDSLVSLSKSFIPELMELYDGPYNHLCSIGNPLSFQINRNNLKENIVLWVGRMDMQKRPDLMLKIWKKLNIKDWKLIMLGDGPLFKEIETKAKKLSNIQLLGFQDPLPYYQKSKILCMTSGHEGFPMVLNEAMSQGCTPIAFDSFAALKDILFDEAQICKPFDITEYAIKLKTMMTDLQIQQRIQVQDYITASSYQIERIADQWENLFKKLLHQ